MKLNSNEERKCRICGKTLEMLKLDTFPNAFYIRCSCQIEQEERARAAQIAAGHSLWYSAVLDAAGIPKRYRQYELGDIKPKDGQEAAFSAVSTWIHKYENEREAEGVILSGGTGSGKTLLAAALGIAVIKLYPLDENAAQQIGKNNKAENIYAPIVFESTTKLFDKLHWAINQSGDEYERIMRKLEECKVLVLDDFGIGNLTEWQSKKLYDIVNARYTNNLPIIITTNETPAVLEEYAGERTFDRLREMCKFIVLTSKSQRVTAGT